MEKFINTTGQMQTVNLEINYDKIKDKTVDLNILKTQEKIEKILGLKVNITNKKNNSGKVSIVYKDLDQFQLISDLLSKN